MNFDWTKAAGVLVMLVAITLVLAHDDQVPNPQEYAVENHVCPDGAKAKVESTIGIPGAVRVSCIKSAGFNTGSHYGRVTVYGMLGELLMQTKYNKNGWQEGDAEFWTTGLREVEFYFKHYAETTQLFQVSDYVKALGCGQARHCVPRGVLPGEEHPRVMCAVFRNKCNPGVAEFCPSSDHGSWTEDANEDKSYPSKFVGVDGTLLRQYCHLGKEGKNGFERIVEGETSRLLFAKTWTNGHSSQVYFYFVRIENNLVYGYGDLCDGKHNFHKEGAGNEFLAIPCFAELQTNTTAANN